MGKPSTTRRSALSLEAAKPFEEAMALRARGEWLGAERLLHRALLLAPEHPAILNALGNLAVSTRRYGNAIGFHRRAVSAEPREPGYRNDLANALILAGEPQNAIPHLKKALGDVPGAKPIALNLVRAHRDLGAADKALAMLDNLRAPEDPDVALERGLILAQTGDGAAARVEFRKVLAHRLDDHRAVDGLATCHRATVEENDLGLAEAALRATPERSAMKRSVIHRALGKINEDLDRVDAAFAHFEAANIATGAAFDWTAHERYISGSIALFTRAFLEQRAGVGARSARPVFVIGMPRSGTTLVEQILASHPDVAALGELTDIETGLMSAVRQSSDAPGFFERVAELEPKALRAAGQRYLDAIAARGAQRARAVDKMPHNFLFLGWIRLILPGASIIHCTRDPLDTCVSCYTHRFSEAHAYSTDLTKLGDYYRSYERLMAHWQSVLPSPPLEVRYERLVADLEGESRRMIAHLGLDWRQECLAFHKTRRVVQTPSQWQVRQPLYASSIGRWRKFERHLGPLRAALGEP
jgi:Flp pilus assembly protein TadD